MRLTLTQFLTLDGVIQGPGGPSEDTRGGFTHGGWVVPYFDDELGAYMGSIFDEADGFVLGRTTYEIFASAWPQNTNPDDPIAGRLNNLPKYVASTTLDTVGWNNSTLLHGDAATEVAKLKEQPGRELQMHGSGGLAQTLFDAGLIDTFRLIVFPVVLGAGKRLFTEGRTPSALRLVDLKSNQFGVTMHTFELAGEPTYGVASVE